MRLTRVCLAAACMLALSATAYSQAIISTSAGGNTVYLGINTEGHLNLDTGNVVTNSSRTGLAFFNSTVAGIEASISRPIGPVDSTSPGCFCEGWGVSTSFGLGNAGYANVSSNPGAAAATLVVEVAPTVGTPTSTVHLASLPDLHVEQAYSVAVAGALFKDHVKISNSSATDTYSDIKYVRVMDWDVPFDEFAEYVTHENVVANLVSNGGKIETASDNGFASANPLDGPPGFVVAGTVDTNFADNGPADHGSYFRFNFGSLLPGASVEFDVFYGAAPNEADMIAALTSQLINVWSLGQSGPAWAQASRRSRETRRRASRSPMHLVSKALVKSSLACPNRHHPGLGRFGPGLRRAARTFCKSTASRLPEA